MQSENACLNTETLGNINRKNSGAVIIKYSTVLWKIYLYIRLYQLTATHSVIEKLKLSSKRSSSPWKRQRFCGSSKKHYAISWVMNLVNLSAIWTQDDVAKWRPTFVLTTSGCFRINKYIINHLLNSFFEFLKGLRSLIRLLF